LRSPPSPASSPTQCWHTLQNNCSSTRARKSSAGTHCKQHLRTICAAKPRFLYGPPGKTSCACISYFPSTHETHLLLVFQPRPPAARASRSHAFSSRAQKTAKNHVLFARSNKIVVPTRAAFLAHNKHVFLLRPASQRQIFLFTAAGTIFPFPSPTSYCIYIGGS
jgi:hypothetical protein